MPYPDKFTGFQVNGPDTWLEFHKNEFQPKPFGDYDVDIKVECCGVCGSDVHTISGGWGEQHFPLAVGHGELPAGYLPDTAPGPNGCSQRSSARQFAWGPRLR
jgi:hypothetical protein